MRRLFWGLLWLAGTCFSGAVHADEVEQGFSTLWEVLSNRSREVRWFEVHELGLAEHGVSFIADDHNVPRLLPIEVVQRAKALGEEIIAGKIKVPDR